MHWDSALIAAGVSAVVSFIGLWINQKEQRKYFVDTHVVKMLEDCEKRVEELEKINVQLISNKGTFIERSELAMQFVDISTSISTDLLLTYSLKNPDFKKELKEIGEDTKYFIVPAPADAPAESIKKGAIHAQRLSRNIVKFRIAIGGAKMLKIDELSGHKNRNKITRRKKISRAIKKWWKSSWDNYTKNSKAK